MDDYTKDTITGLLALLTIIILVSIFAIYQGIKDGWFY